MFEIYTIEVTPFSQNARILFDSETRATVVVDPGGDLPDIFSVLKTLKPLSIDVLLTHAHLDHAGAVAPCLTEAMPYVERLPRLFAHHEPMLRGLVQQSAKMYALPISNYQNVPEPDVFLEDKQTFAVGSIQGEVLYTPGHAPDHIAIYFPKIQAKLYLGSHMRSKLTEQPIVIAGDALFQGSIGRTDLPGGSSTVLIRSIREKLLTLPDDTLVLCGHGPNTTIAQERQFNPFL